MQKNIFFNGNIKFIKRISKNEINNLNKQTLINNKFWFAASTHENEEIFCLRTHLKIKKKI